LTIDLLLAAAARPATIDQSSLIKKETADARSLPLLKGFPANWLRYIDPVGDDELRGITRLFKDQELRMSKVISAHDLGINLHDANEKGLFQWLVASFLMGKPRQAEIAADAYRVIVEKHQRDTPRKLAYSSHRELVAMLGEARYVRYDETTAARLLALANKLNDEYAGKVGQMVEASADQQDLEKRLEIFEGVGAKNSRDLHARGCKGALLRCQ
jgi:hypothetical protein